MRSHEEMTQSFYQNNRSFSKEKDRPQSYYGDIAPLVTEEHSKVLHFHSLDFCGNYAPFHHGNMPMIYFLCTWFHVTLSRGKPK
jgi:hypothetical protein